jgi:hypothetical protein
MGDQVIRFQIKLDAASVAVLSCLTKITEEAFVYIEVSPNNEIRAQERVLDFLLVSTGLEYPENAVQFIGTLSLHGGQGIYHLFLL